MVMADLARAMSIHLQMDWMAVSSYGSGTKSSGVVRILKDLDTDITGRHVLDRRGHHRLRSDPVVADAQPDRARCRPRSRSLTMLRKPEAVKVDVEPKYIGFDIPNEFVVGLRPGLRREVPQPPRDRARWPRTSTAEGSGSVGSAGRGLVTQMD